MADSVKEGMVAVDHLKLMRWFNARKVTPAIVAQKTGIASSDLEDLIQSKKTQASRECIRALAAVLNVPEDFLLKSEQERRDTVIYWSAATVQATKREITRDGIHFYNYYTWPSPKGYVAPVVLDILCPKDRVPALNNGHLEAAITINLGPGDIHGRWAVELTPDTYRVMEANKSKENAWVLGDTYVETAFRPHSYGLVGDTPAQILSYTMKSDVEALFTALNEWPDYSFESLADGFEKLPKAAVFLREQMDRQGYEASRLGAETGVPTARLSAFLNGDSKSLSLDELKTLSAKIGLDYRLVLEPISPNDGHGKLHFSYKQSLESIRAFKSYRVASMAASSEFPDLSGLFMKVDKKTAEDLDLSDPGNVHYCVSEGQLVITWLDHESKTARQTLEKGDALWVGPYVKHAFSGSGSLIKMTNGENVSYLDRYAASNTFELGKTLKRSRKDSTGWGYDKKQG